MKIKRRKLRRIKRKPYARRDRGVRFLSRIVDFADRIQSGADEIIINMGRGFIVELYKISAAYKHTRRVIGMVLLSITITASGMLVLFNRFTVYEYAYNGKVLGYVREQEEVTEVLEIAGQKLSENSGSSLDVEFVANRNITFDTVDSRGKSIDNSDAAVNKLVYMTDIETEAFGVYDGEELVAVVKDSDDAEKLLLETQAEMSRPDTGMTLVSSEFANALDIKPLNVLLISVQDNASARRQMIKGGNMEIYHIVEEGESIETLMQDFSVAAENIYDESNSDIATEPEQGDKVCIHKTVEPLSVTMVETGRMKEIVEYKTVKRESDEYYKGDTFIEQEGVDGIQVFEGTITKESGEVVDRKTDKIETIRKVQDKIILVGTAERPKTAATGVFAMPVQRYTITSPFGPRWGRMHTGLDLAGPTGTPIYASDGGTVIRAGYNGGYGNCVDIDHENGYITRYAHCSRLIVSAGDKVYQGQNIAFVGSTGNSTGPHLHFEIISNGSAINPAPKLGL
ncbi:MAG: peptidoglycan DD-metalloendopeptidase family protein [Mogibacterium sp.]|nr:peptidoglycan DD-metalloendopeptidase family protein [Mogibacterium sp.]